MPGRLRHDFRRTAVWNLERAAVRRSVAMKVTGHKTESVYRRYAIVSDADFQAASDRLTLATRHISDTMPAWRLKREVQVAIITGRACSSVG